MENRTPRILIVPMRRFNKFRRWCSSLSLGSVSTFTQQQELQGLGISAISCWEIAKLVERGRLMLPIPVDEWLDQALAYPGMRLLELTPRICVESTQFSIHLFYFFNPFGHFIFMTNFL